MNGTKEVTVFTFNSQSVRSLTDEKGEPWFVAKDVCEILDLDNVTKALLRIPENHLALNLIQGEGGMRQVNTVDEPGLYRLILRSNKPEAEPFMEWVTSEVLPSIRKSGSYSVPQVDELGKVIDVRHSHIRSTQAPGGLDIRYTLDLTKVVLQPTQKSLSLLERVTGIDLSELVEELSIPPSSSAVGLVREFIDQCCRPADESDCINLSTIYEAYQQWFKKYNYPAVLLTLRRQFSRLLQEAGYGKQKRGGMVKIFGLELVAGEPLDA